VDREQTDSENKLNPEELSEAETSELLGGTGVEPVQPREFFE
jgi:hypothetical protein